MNRRCVSIAACGRSRTRAPTIVLGFGPQPEKLEETAHRILSREIYTKYKSRARVGGLVRPRSGLIKSLTRADTAAKRCFKEPIIFEIALKRIDI